MDDHRFHSAGYGTSTRPYSYSNTIHQQQQDQRHQLPSPRTPEMYAQPPPPASGPLPPMGGPQNISQPPQYPPQNTYQPQMSQAQYQYSQQPGSYPQSQAPFTQHATSYQPSPAPLVMSAHQVVHAGQQPPVQAPTTHTETAGYSPHSSVTQSEDNGPVRLEDEDAFKGENPPPAPEDHIHDDKVWELRVVQQPKRARMCGYGDKDRRPITCPPILQLQIKDPRTGNEIDYTQADVTISHFTCIAHLNGLQKNEDRSILRSHPQQQIVSVASVHGWPATLAPQKPEAAAPRVETGRYPAAPYGQNGFSSSRNLFPPMGRAPSWSSQHMNVSGPATTPYGQAPSPSSLHLPSLPPHHPASIRPQQPPTPPLDQSNNLSPGTVFQRNLIGATSSSAQLLRDENDKPGIYFIFPDMSVRTEDWFRLKFQIFNVAECLKGLTQDEIMLKATENDAAPSNNVDGKRNSKNLEGLRNSLVGKTAPCLSTCWSECFRVYSAKKFPGVAESTKLSKVFAEQGVKISVRKDSEKDQEKAGDKRKRNSTGSDENQDEDNED